MLLLFLFYLSHEYIIVDSGLFIKSDYWSNGYQYLCKDASQRSQTVLFSNTFANIPQVMLQINRIDFMTELANVEVKITNITVKNFTLYFDCPNNSNSAGYKIQWYALDDQRISVYNYFNQYAIVNKIVIFNNTNADKCFVSLVSLGISGKVNFSIYLDSQTTCNVQVVIKIVTGADKLIQIGYQVICGLSSFINQVGLFFTNVDNQYNFLTNQANSLFLTPFVQINWLFTNSLRLEQTFVVASPQISVKTSSWMNTYFENTVNQVFVSYQITTVFTSYFCQMVRISQILDKHSDEKYNFYVVVQELNQIFNQPDTFPLQINKSYSRINIMIYSKCATGHKITAQIKKCKTCTGSQNHNLSRNCNNQINQIIYTARFKQSMVAHVNLQIVITANNYTIQHVLYNQQKTYETLALVRSLPI